MSSLLTAPSLSPSSLFQAPSTSKPNQRQLEALSPNEAGVVLSPGVAIPNMGENWGAPGEGNAPEWGKFIEVQSPKAIRRLPSNVKQFIVINNACGSSPSQVAKAVKEVFGLDVSAQAVERYDPTKTAGQSLSLPLKTLFREMQREFQTMVVKAGVADQSWRIAKLHLIAQHCFDQGNYQRTMEAMEQAAKDLGGVYTNKARIEVDDKKMLPARLLRCAPEDLPGMKASVEEAKAVSDKTR